MTSTWVTVESFPQQLTFQLGLQFSNFFECLPCGLAIALGAENSSANKTDTNIPAHMKLIFQGEEKEFWK